MYTWKLVTGTNLAIQSSNWKSLVQLWCGGKIFVIADESNTFICDMFYESSIIFVATFVFITWMLYSPGMIRLYFWPVNSWEFKSSCYLQLKGIYKVWLFIFVEELNQPNVLQMVRSKLNVNWFMLYRAHSSLFPKASTSVSYLVVTVVKYNLGIT